jgi:OOP family OmpA-OmpF porin
VVDAAGCPPPAPAAVPAVQSLTLHLQFAYGDAGIRPEFDQDLQVAADFIKAHPGSRILVEGHTDSIGSVESNLALSKARAAEVRRTLVEKYNLDAGRIETEGFGEARPVADNSTPDGRLRNRRVVITVLPGL